MRTVVYLCLAMLLSGSAWAEPVSYPTREDVQKYIGTLVEEHGFNEAQLTDLFDRAERKQSILDAISRPAERTLKWHEYRKIFLTDSRVNLGVEFWLENRKALERAHEQFGVAPEIIVAIIGVETRYGRNAGNYRVVDALTTLGFDYPPRSKFFRKELTEFLLLAREEGKDPFKLKGSYAGAMGYGQFIPSSFRAYAVDFDDDGLRDIWNNKQDAIGSVANYFSVHGWQGTQAVVVPVEVTTEAAKAVANDGLDLKYRAADLEELGVVVPEIDAETPSALFRFENKDGDEYWLAFNDFYVITRYNRSRMYSLAVYQLSQALKVAADKALALKSNRAPSDRALFDRAASDRARTVPAV